MAAIMTGNGRSHSRISHRRTWRDRMPPQPDLVQPHSVRSRPATVVFRTVAFRTVAFRTVAFRTVAFRTVARTPLPAR
ncbi:hypothetical protein [Streptomyces bacillaris]|uniref:hypothetical protein n=1 Tax=Streptomyces bacillaris TaxID=68179 RepID=UPI0037FC12C0